MTGAGCASGGAFWITISAVVDATVSVFKPGNEIFTVALPSPHCSGTPTGPWNWLPQQRSSSVYFAVTGAAPALAGGKVISRTGFTSSGTSS